MPAGGGTELPSGRITLLLTDVEGSTAAWDRDPVAMDEQMARHDDFVAATVAAHGGLLLKMKGEGDSTFSVFEDAGAGVAAALAVLRGLSSIDFGLPVRAAVHTGEVAPRGGDYFGPVPNRGSRLRGLANGGQILLSSSTVSAVADALPDGAEVVALGTHQLRGLAEPEAVFALAHPDLSPVAQLVVVRPATNLPAPVDAFVGRDDDRTALEKAMGAHRLVTIVGPGGVGKTRLALETAADQAHAMPGGTYYVDVGALTAPDQVQPAVAAAVGAAFEPGDDPTAAIAGALPERAMLVLDTCERHLEAAADLVDGLLLAVGNLAVVATSQQALAVKGEAVLRLDPLTVGGPANAPSDAAELFLLRASAANLAADVQLDLAAVERICIALDGIPLAIELAAAQVGALGLDQLADELTFAVGVEQTDAVRRSGPARQRTVRAAVLWSLESATAAERALLARLTAFVGSWPRGAPQAVCADEETTGDAVSHALAGLVARSLVVAAPDTGAGSRHRLLDAVRTIAAESLDTATAVALQRRFLDWAVERAETLEREAADGRLPDWVAHYAAEMPNLRAGLSTALASNDADLAQRLAVAMSDGWEATGSFVEAVDVLDAAIDLGGGGTSRLRALSISALVSLRLGTFDAAATRVEEALAIVRGSSDLPESVRSDTFAIASLFYDHIGQHDEVRTLCRDALEAARRSGEARAIAVALNNLACSLPRRDQHERVRLLAEAAAIETELGAHVMAQTQYAAALGHGGDPERGVRVLDGLDRSDIDPYSRFVITGVRATLEVQLDRASEAVVTAREAVGRAAELALGEDEVGDVTLTLARALHRLGRSEEALTTLSVTESSEWRRSVSTLTAEILGDIGALDEAEAKLPASDPEDEIQARVAAKLALARGRATEALDIVEPMIDFCRQSGLGTNERRLLEVALSAREKLGFTDDPSTLAAQARHDELAARSRTAS